MDKTIYRLRLKVTLLVTAMVGVVLASVLVVEYLNARGMQEDLISDSLHGHMMGDSGGRFQMGGPAPDAPPHDGVGGEASRHSSILMGLSVTASADGTVTETRGDSIEIGGSVLSSVIGRVLSGETQGTDWEMGLAWLGEPGKDGDGFVNVSIVDVSSIRETLSRQAYAEVVMFVVAIGVVAIMAWLFSWSAVRPIAEAWESQRRFVSDASHELKTPLAVIKANMSVMRKGHAGDDMTRWVDSTTEEADRMSSLIVDMLELARTEESAGKGHAGDGDGFVPFDLSQLAEETAMEMDAIAFERGHVLEEDIEDGVTVVGDAEKIGRLLRVLIDNATKYGGEGSPVVVSLRATRRHAILSVHNDGNPIPEGDLSHVFDRFYRSDKARTADESRSFGLGLPIAKGIAESHGGTLAVESDETDGTTFSLTLRRRG